MVDYPLFGLCALGLLAYCIKPLLYTSAPGSHLRMKAKLEDAAKDLGAFDEELIELHGMGMIDGFTHKFLEPMLETTWYHRGHQGTIFCNGMVGTPSLLMAIKISSPIQVHYQPSSSWDDLSYFYKAYQNMM